MLEFVLTIFAIFAMITLGAIQGNLEKQEDPRASAVSLMRLSLMSVYVAALLLTQAISQPFFAILAAVVILTFVLQQLIGKAVANSKLGERLTEKYDSVISKAAEVYKPLRLTVPVDAEDFEQELIESVEEFSETVVREVMVPRVDLEVVDQDQTLEEALSVFISTGYSRLPVVGESVDDVVGVLYLKDLARVTHQDPALLATTTAKQAARKPLFTPETKPVHELLQEMKISQTQIAIVSDEYGGVAGIATMEDLIEEIVGEISDEYDREGEDFELVAKDQYRVDPRVTLAELEEQFEIEIDDPDVDTVGGLFSKALGELPRGGEVVEIHGLELLAERVEAKKQRIISLLVKRVESAESDD
jgi:CBS domain containing-hemolysin-like protein